jgi:hypothetical protein
VGGTDLAIAVCVGRAGKEPAVQLGIDVALPGLLIHDDGMGASLADFLDDVKSGRHF